MQNKKTMREYTLKEVTKEVNINNRKSQVFDFDKIEDLGYPIVIIMSQRGYMGKTTNLLDKIGREYIENGDSFLYLGIVNKTLKKAVPKLIENFHKTKLEGLEVLANCKQEGSIEQETFKLTDSNNVVMSIASLSNYSYEKSARNYRDRILFDEFNEGLGKLKGVNYNYALFNIISSYTNQVTGEKSKFLYFFGNNMTMSSPLINQLQLDKIKGDITGISINKHKFLLFIKPKLNKKEIEELVDKEEGNWTFQLAQELGQDKFIAYNESYYDNSINVLDVLSNWKKFNTTFLMSIHYKVKKESVWFNLYLYTFNGTKKYHLILVNDLKDLHPKYENRQYFSNKHITDNIRYNYQLKDNIKNQLHKNNITFQDFYTRTIFLDNF